MVIKQLEISSNRIKTINQNDIHGRKFANKLSPLTELFKVKDFKTVYHIFIFILISSLINNIAYDYARKGEIRLGLHIILSTFGKFYIVVAIWSLMFILTLLCYFTFVQWAELRSKLEPKSNDFRILIAFGLFLTVIYYAVLICLPTKLLLYYDLPVVSSSVILAEQIRHLMKSHAFIRDNVGKVINYKPHSDQPLPYPSFKHYLYFLFVPTLVYKDEYPRTKTIDWNYVVKCFLEVLATIFYLCFILDHFYFEEFKDVCIVKRRLVDIILKISFNTIPAFLVWLFGFYCLLHAWMNGFAEMLRFADREFYKDWWNSTTYTRFYRTWNTIVHDWLHTYIYNEMYYNIFKKNRLMAKLMVFLISAIVHEYILSYMLRYFFPLLFLQFSVFGVALTFINKESVVGNIFMWYSLGLGFSTILTFYNVEYVARLNCPIDVSNMTLMDYVVPRFISCNCVELFSMN